MHEIDDSFRRRKEAGALAKRRRRMRARLTWVGISVCLAGLVLAVASALTNPDAQYTLVDESYMAVQSAQENWQAALGERPVTVGRELTKQFEQIATLPCAELPAWLAADAQRQRGEFALVLHPAPGADDSAESERVLRLLLAELPTKSAVKLAADITGAPGSKGRQVVDTPRFMARTGLSYRWGNFEISPSIRYLGPRFGNATHTERIGSHVVADLALNYTRKKALGNATLKAGLELNNLFNRKYVAVVNASDDNQGGAASYMAGAPFGAALKVGLEW